MRGSSLSKMVAFGDERAALRFPICALTLGRFSMRQNANLAEVSLHR